MAAQTALKRRYDAEEEGKIAQDGERKAAPTETRKYFHFLVIMLPFFTLIMTCNYCSYSMSARKCDKIGQPSFQMAS